MPKTHDIIDLRQRPSESSERCAYKMFKIKTIHVDGYRNILNTTIRLADPITVLLAPNNFGKTNLLHAIEFATELVGQGVDRQERRISANRYTSHNKQIDKKDVGFTFKIEFEFKLSETLEYVYQFTVSPRGVMHEKLDVGHVNVFTRNTATLDASPDDVPISLNMSDRLVYVSSHSLLVSQLTDKSVEESKYAEAVRKIFDGMSNMFCNRESPYGSYLNDEKRKLSSIIHSILKLFDNDRNRFFQFRNSFKGLFNQMITDFIIYDVRDRNKKVFPDSQFPSSSDSHEVDAYKIDFTASDYRPDDYRLEFNSSAKSINELFDDLSTGTQDIFLVLLEVFTKKGNPVIAIEELENGIHPSLYRNVLATLEKECREANKSALITTHSPAVIKHFSNRSFSSLYIGIPNKNGVATFAALDDIRKDDINKKAKLHGVSVGELVIDMLSESDESKKILKEWLRYE